MIVKVLVPELTSVLILEAVATVIVPVNVAAFAPLTSLIAPASFIPVPFIVIASGIDIADPPLISMTVPLAIIVPCEFVLVPNAPPLVICTTPVVIEVVPA